MAVSRLADSLWCEQFIVRQSFGSTDTLAHDLQTIEHVTNVSCGRYRKMANRADWSSALNCLAADDVDGKAGGRTTNDGFFIGLVDELRIWCASCVRSVFFLRGIELDEGSGCSDGAS